MKLVIITHVEHIKEDNQYYGYAPYVGEMNIWLKYADEVIVVAPLVTTKKTSIDIAYQHNQISFRQVPGFDITTFKNAVSSLVKLPVILLKLFSAMKAADHIHLRCPGNIGLLGCMIQIFFPYKTKTAKYAGNWDPESKQPRTYKLQKYILSNTFLTRNMQVLVYGHWNNQSKNIKPFFTATYSESEKTVIQQKTFDAVLQFVFVGSLVTGKNPIYAVKLIHNLVEKGNKVILNIYGEGVERSSLEAYIKDNKLETYVALKGNQNKETLKKAYQSSHFVILPSKSEGWPKAIAEAMFWECLPISTQVSCVPFMLDYGKRGILLKMDLEQDTAQIESVLENEDIFLAKSQLACAWSQNYTTDFFEAEIKKLLLK